MTATSWMLLLLMSCQQVYDAKPCRDKHLCCKQESFAPRPNQTQRSDTCNLAFGNNASQDCSICVNGERREQAGHNQYTQQYCTVPVQDDARGNCKCFLLCSNKFYECEVCESNDGQRPHVSSGKQTGKNSWDKKTFGTIIGVIVVSVAVVLIVTFRKKINCSRGDQNNQSQRNSKRNLDEEGVSGCSRFTSPSDPDSSTGMYRLQRDREVGRNYRPLGQSITQTSYHFQLQTSIHRPFEDENEDEIYNEINDEDIRCFPERGLFHNATSRQVCEVPPSFLERQWDQAGGDGGYYKKLDRHTARDNPTDCMSAANENYQRLPGPQPSGGYVLAKAVTDAHVHSTTAHEEPSNNKVLSDNTPLNNISNDHNPYDNAFSDNSPENISENHSPEGSAVCSSDNNPHDNAFSDNSPEINISANRNPCSPYDNISSDNNPHDKSLPENNAHHENTEHNISDDKTPHEETHLDPTAHEPCP
ncbi:uncharacterized protein LOC112560372 isoform X2 [Pomacea canaliculata]|uniref:uncharacterized protein LOC112560372 isoform X2 n=1 Tax=Pomacea canaliculata TaxID=400727 RepID=UPI000D736F11|nr:uncharacterized protein LOC112560372 isoform X2 [Pomacea canaliculata]